MKNKTVWTKWVTKKCFGLKNYQDINYLNPQTEEFNLIIEILKEKKVENCERQN